MGFITVVGGPHFFVFLDAADRMAIGEKSYYQEKVGSFRDSIRVSVLFGKFVICGIL